MRTEVHGRHLDGHRLVQVGDAQRVERRGAHAVQELAQHEDVAVRRQPLLHHHAAARHSLPLRRKNTEYDFNTIIEELRDTAVV